MKAWIDRGLNFAIVVLLASMAVVCCWQVFTRYVMGSPSKVTEEYLRYALIWLTMLGTPYAYGLNQHLAITFLSDTFSLRGKYRTAILVDACVLFLAVAVFIGGGVFVCVNSAGQVSAALHLPMYMIYGCLPISGLITAYYAIRKLAVDFHNKKTPLQA